MIITLFFALAAQGTPETKIPTGSEERISADAQIWDARQEEFKKTIKEMNDILKKNGRAVRRGNENPRVESLLAQAINRLNTRLKRRNLKLNVSREASKHESFLPVTTHEVEFMLSSMDPYRREFAEMAFRSKRILGDLLTGRGLSVDQVPESLEGKNFVDLETYTATGDRKFDELMQSFIKRGGKRCYALILPKVELPDGSYSASPIFTVEQTKDGNIKIFQERLKTRSADALSIQVFTTAPRQILFVPKDELETALSSKTQIQSLVLTVYRDEPPVK